jgi:predicted RNA-binding Zn-ribbon protein involved in translation (DUF1610 family)
MLDWLRRAGMARRDVEPDPELLGELLPVAAPKLSCPDCGAVGLVVRELALDNDEDWGMPRACRTCGKPIGRERLAALPNAQECVACQGRTDRGGDSGPAEYCPRCGNVMTLRQGGTAGVTRYVMACPKCRSR